MTYLSNRVVHLEVVQNIETESFIQTLRRFIAHRGNIKLIRCDNDTNFVVNKSELQRSLSDMDEDKIPVSCRMVELIWKNNPPSRNQMGGVWEHQIKSALVIPSA